MSSQVSRDSFRKSEVVVSRWTYPGSIEPSRPFSLHDPAFMKNSVFKMRSCREFVKEQGFLDGLVLIRRSAPKRADSDVRD
jgi:hypothetical protein